jgi:L-alanine-DL-glutamate epimerase-like enolase superfamily enzyme
MKIAAVEVFPLRYTLPRGKWDAHLDIAYRDTLVLLLRTDEGTYGVGEAAAFGGATSAVASVVSRQLAPLLVGADPLQIKRLWRQMYDHTVHLGRSGVVMAAISGIDIALWDLAGKAAGLPLFRMLGAAHTELATYASGGLYEVGVSPDAVVDEFLEYQRRGFTAGKMKVAGLDMKDDCRRVESVRAAVGGDFGVMVDANCGYSLPEALKFCRRVRDLDLAWVEEPLSVDDLEGSIELTRSAGVVIAGYESLSSLFAFRDLIVNRAVHIVQADATWAGGVTNAKRIADLADAWHRVFAPHVFSSGIAFMANLHLLASCSNAGPLEFDGQPNPLKDEILHGLPQPDGRGVISVPETPGLGIELDHEAIRRYRLDE